MSHVKLKDGLMVLLAVAIPTAALAWDKESCSTLMTYVDLTQEEILTKNIPVEQTRFWNDLSGDSFLASILVGAEKHVKSGGTPQTYTDYVGRSCMKSAGLEKAKK